MAERDRVVVRHVRGVGDMTIGAFRLFLTLAFVLVWALILSIVSFTGWRSTKDDLKHERIARNVAAVVRCRTSITTTTTANRVIDDQRMIHLDRARQIKKIRSTDKSKRLYDIHTEIIQTERRKAAELKEFPVVTKQQCDALAESLGVDA